MTARAFIITLGLLAAGCGEPAAPTAPAKGKANLRVTVSPRPKTGAKPFLTYQPSEAAKAEAAASTGQFELVDYEDLDEIVVWLEPKDPAGKPPAARHKLQVKPKPTNLPLMALSVGDAATVTNTGSRPMRLYSVSEGNEFDIGPLEPGGEKDQTLAAPGLVELIDGETFDVVARVYVAPGLGARVLRAEEPTTFRDIDPRAYRVVAWHERLPGGDREATLAPDSVRELTVVIGVNALPKVE